MPVNTDGGDQAVRVAVFQRQVWFCTFLSLMTANFASDVDIPHLATVLLFMPFLVITLASVCLRPRYLTALAQRGMTAGYRLAAVVRITVRYNLGPTSRTGSDIWWSRQAHDDVWV